MQAAPGGAVVYRAYVALSCAYSAARTASACRAWVHSIGYASASTEHMPGIRIGLPLLLGLQLLDSVVAASGVGGSGTCADVVTDCGAAADGITDDTLAFVRCQRVALAGSGCITVPARSFRVLHIHINTSHVHWLFDGGATLSPPPGNGQWIAGAVFDVGAANGNRTDTTSVRNVSFSGVTKAGKERFTVDISKPESSPWRAAVSSVRIECSTCVRFVISHPAYVGFRRRLFSWGT